MTLSDRIVRYLKGRNWVASGEIQRLAIEKAGQTGKTASRRLQELAEDGILEVEYREKHHAFYRVKERAVDVFEIAGLWQEKSPWTGEVTGEYHEIYT